MASVSRAQSLETRPHIRRGFGYFRCPRPAHRGSGSRLCLHAAPGEKVSAGFELVNLGMRYGDAQVLSEINLRLEFSQLTALGGPNGAGKSTLLGILSRLRTNFSGACSYGGQALAKWRLDRFASEV